MPDFDANEGVGNDDLQFTGSRFGEVRDAIFANPYPKPFPQFPVTLGSVLHGFLPFGKPWNLLAAARRVVASQADLRWGPDGKGAQRLLHPNAVCLTGMWEITADTPYTGYFKQGSRGLIIARYSTCCTETRGGFTRSLAMIARLYPTTDRNHPDKLPTASFITQQDIGGELVKNINEAVLRNAPNVTASQRGLGGFGVFLATGLALGLADKQNTIRQVYQIAELGKPAGDRTSAPEFMQLTVVPEQPVMPGEHNDFRDEILWQLGDGKAASKRTLTFRIETSDTGTTHGLPVKQRRDITNWRSIGTITFDSAVASYNGDHVLHFNHPPWRFDRNDPSTAFRKGVK
ncbi:MAG TPA: hypothetical protein VHX14_12160 [Thermoanaerobaculia bacterium]|jgi:hypothetical protein|nr:hypothetical protein [Thermoanaerobaculia bacterium]